MGVAHPPRGTIERVSLCMSGSRRQDGRAYGERYGADIRRQIEAYNPLFEMLGLGSEQVASLADERVLPASEHAFPEYVAELRGRAEGAHVAFRDLFTLSCLEEIWSWVGPEKMRELEELAQGHVPSGRCTTLAFKHKGRALLAHNEDWSAVDSDSTMLLHDVALPDGTGFLSPQFVGMLPWAGMNSHGLAITANTLPTADARPEAANALVLRSALEARSLEEVWQRVRTPSRGLGTFVVAADARGRVWAIETSARRASRRAVATWLAETNHFTDEAMVSLRAQPVSEDSLARLARATELVSAGIAEADDLAALARSVLADHAIGRGRAICSHPRQGVPQPLQMATMASTVYEPRERRLWISVAPACEHRPQLFELNGEASGLA